MVSTVKFLVFFLIPMSLCVEGMIVVSSRVLHGVQYKVPVLQIFFFFFFPSDSLSGWEYINGDGDYSAYRKLYKDTGLFQYKVVGRFADVTAKDFLEVQVRANCVFCTEDSAPLGVGCPLSMLGAKRGSWQLAHLIQYFFVLCHFSWQFNMLSCLCACMHAYVIVPIELL